MYDRHAAVSHLIRCVMMVTLRLTRLVSRSVVWSTSKPHYIGWAGQCTIPWCAAVGSTCAALAGSSCLHSYRYTVVKWPNKERWGLIPVCIIIGPVKWFDGWWLRRKNEEVWRNIKGFAWILRPLLSLVRDLRAHGPPVRRCGWNIDFRAGRLPGVKREATTISVDNTIDSWLLLWGIVWSDIEGVT